MAFEKSKEASPTPPTPPTPREPLTRLAALYPSKAGTSLGGNLHVTSPLKGHERPLGEELIDLIQQAIEAERPLRFLVFENSGKFENAPPYSLHVTLGEARPAQVQEPQDVAAPPRPPRRRFV